VAAASVVTENLHMTAALAEPDPLKAPVPTSREMFFGFLMLGIIAFGGVLPLAHRMLVDQRRWLSNEEFAELLGLCQFLPGGNIINLAVAIGMKFRGPSGAFAALMGLISAPTVIVVLLGMVYDHFQHDTNVRNLFAGFAAAAAGLLISMAIKIGWPLRKRWPLALVALVCFAAIALLRLPLLPTMLALTPVSIYVTWKAKL
jgi:chromate transporter